VPRVKPMLTLSPLRAGRAISIPDRASMSAEDERILSVLQADGRVPYSKIARDFGLSARTVARRVQSLEEDGVISFVALTDARLFGYTARAAILVQLEPTAKRQAALDVVTKFPSVSYVAVTAGPADLYVDVVCRTLPDILRFVDESLSLVPGLASFEILPIVGYFYFRDVGGPTSSLQALDEMDRRIILQLIRDARLPYKMIGDAVGASEPQVRRRVNQLVHNGALRVVSVINPLALGWTSTAMVGVRADGGVVDVAKRLSAHDPITWLATVSGSYDIFVEIVAASRADIFDFVNTHIRSVPGVRDTRIFESFSIYHQPKFLLELEGAANG
jgi:DNA-binding Lrp family transcriptional regulator